MCYRNLVMQRRSFLRLIRWSGRRSGCPDVAVQGLQIPFSNNTIALRSEGSGAYISEEWLRRVSARVAIQRKDASGSDYFSA